MPYPADVVHVVLGGALPGGEQWESGFWVSDAGVSTPAAANALCELVYSSLVSTDEDQNALSYLAEQFLNAGSTVAYCRCLVYTTEGTHAQFAGEYTPPSALGGSASGSMPNQVACVVTLRSDAAGRSYRGRMYMPATGAAVGTGQFSNPIVDAFCTKWAGFFSDWDSSGDNGKIVVVSSTKTSAVEVTRVTVDTRPDIQRRRAKSQLPAHTASAVVMGA